MRISAFERKLALAICATIACFSSFLPQLAHAQDTDPSSPDIEAALDAGEADASGQNHKVNGEQPANLTTGIAAPQNRQILQDGNYDVGPVLISGMQALAPSDFLDIIEAHSARNLSQDDLTGLTDQVVARAREHGYVFASAWIEPQSLETGVLRVTLDEGTISELRISGDDDPAIHAQLAPLLDGTPVTLEKLERQILLADDVAGVWIRDTQFIREGQRGILLVDARRTHYIAYAELENTGTVTVGPYRARIQADINGLVSSADQIRFTYATTPFQPNELQYGRLRYQVVLNSSGTRLGLTGSYSEAKPGAYLAQSELDGTSWALGISLRQPLQRSRDFSLWLEGDFELRQLRQERLGDLHRLDRVPVMRAGLYASGSVAGGRLRGRLTYSRGLDILNATKVGDPLASRSDASASFNKLYAWVNWSGPLAGDFSLSLAGQGQISTDPLLISEDIGLGGRSFLRGYAYNQRSGDKGAMGSAELRYDWDSALGLVRSVQVYAFADGGVVGNLDDGYGSGSLASSGGGLRADISRNLDLDLEFALPLTGDRYDTGDKDPQLNFRVRQTF